MKAAVYFDLETGGVGDSRPDIQLAAIAIDEGTWAELATFEVKLKFDEKAADPAALELNGYQAEVWAKEAVAPAAAIAGFSSFLNRFRSLQMVSKRTQKPYTVAKLVGHNAASFDGPRLKRLFERHSMFLPADPRVRCTCQRAMWFFDAHGIAPPEDFKLATLCRYFGIQAGASHEALADVRSTIALARAIEQAEKATVGI